MAKSTASMKLSIDKKSKRVIYAEAGKDCVDFLFQILSMPVATIVNFLGHKGMKGSLPKLYESLENLRHEYVEPNVDKYTFLDPVPACSIPLLGLHRQAESTAKTSHGCEYTCYSPSQFRPAYGGYDSDDERCRDEEKAAESGSLVKGEVTYMVTDDLEVKPMSAISTIALLSKFGVKEAGDLEEKVVNMGMNEAVKLLKVMLESKNVLTQVFC